MDDDRPVECGKHDKGLSTYICHHLADGEKLGFNLGYDPDELDELYPDAWCDKCEEMLVREGEWNDVSEAFADIRMVCPGCYQEIRERNWIQDEDEYDRLVSTSFDYLKKIQDSFTKVYEVGSHERWDWDQETAKLMFSHEGEPVLECDIDFVGTLSTATDTWMWSWANSSFTENIKAKSVAIRDIGDENNFLKLACGLWPADEVDGWEMTAIMAKATGAIGAYRTPSDNGFVYMVVSKARWVDPKRNNIVSFIGKK